MSDEIKSLSVEDTGVNQAQERAPSKKYKYYCLSMLTLVYAFNMMDRNILTILMQPIKEELLLSDTQLGLLSGLAFALFYAILGIPIAMWADRGNRRNIISLAVTVWSAMTVLSGFATNYTQLFLARIGVGVGEAGGTPPATAIISDLFPKKESKRSFWG